jgi:hypothetical protein
MLCTLRSTLVSKDHIFYIFSSWKPYAFEMNMLLVCTLLTLKKIADFHETWYEGHSNVEFLLPSICNDMAGVRTNEVEVPNALLQLRR